MAKKIKFSDYFCLLFSELAIHMTSSMKHPSNQLFDVWCCIKISGMAQVYAGLLGHIVTMTAHSYLSTVV